MVTPSFGSLQILNLFAELLNHVLHFEASIGQFEIVGFGAAGVDLAVELLRQEIESPSDRAALADQLARLRDVGGDAVELFAHIRLGRDQERLLIEAVGIETV